MFNPILDLENGSFIFPDPCNGNTGLDTNGNLHIRTGSNMSMDLSTGKLHINSGWNNNDDEDNQE